MTEEEKKKGLEDALCYVQELQDLYDLSLEVLDETESVVERFSMRHAIAGPIGRERICNAIGPKLDPYSGETILGINRDILEDIKFLTKGLCFILEEKYANNL